MWVGLRVVVIGFLVFVVPKFYIAIAESSDPVLIVETQFKLGNENITPQFLYHFVDGPKPISIGLISNHTGLNQVGKRTVDLLREQGIQVKALYAPEHGFSGSVGAEKKIHDNIDPTTKLPIVSLYEGHSQFKKFKSEELKDIDAFFFDMQDCGMRHYTYFPILYKCMELAAEHGKRIIVFDRPNPLGGVMEGPLVDPQNHSFVSIASYPLRHGMTIGELALYCNDKVLKKKARLAVVPMKNYDRLRYSMELPVPLSPNIPNMDACKGYGFLGILGEVKPFWIGVGTKKSFRFMGVPKDLNIPTARWYELKDKLKKFGITSKPTSVYDPKKQKAMRGLKISIDNPNKFSGFNALMTILEHFKDLGYSYAPLFNKAVGIGDVKEHFTSKLGYDPVRDKVNRQLKEFNAKVEPYLIYKPYPVITFMPESVA